MSQRIAIGVLSAIGAQACGDPLVDPAEITAPRVLGARVEASEEPAAAWVRPGEQARLRWLVAAKTGRAEVGWAVSLCVAETVSRGLPQCVAEPVASAQSESVSTEEPALDFTMPPRETLGERSKLAATAAFCSSGTPVVEQASVDTETTRCPAREEKPLFAVVDVHARLDGKTNDNPSLSDVSLRLDDALWAADAQKDASVGEDCRSTTLPKVPADGKRHRIRVTLPGGWSESVPQVSAQSTASESLLLSHFVTGGKLDGAYSVVEATEATRTVELDWTAPRDIGSSEQWVWFFLVARDERGGVDWLERKLCVLP